MKNFQDMLNNEERFVVSVADLKAYLDQLNDNDVIEIRPGEDDYCGACVCFAINGKHIETVYE